METLRNVSKQLAGQIEERGSALLVSLMVMVGLSLLGLGFVAVSETENAISVNERNGQQVFHVAEAGAKLVVEWFQNPDWAELVTGIMPPVANRGDFMIDRMLDMDENGEVISALQNLGKYKNGDDRFCCDRPFKPAPVNRLYGIESNPDIWIGYKGRDGTDSAVGAAFLGALNDIMFKDREGGRIVEIRVYAPPIIGGYVNTANFYDHNVGTRYGLATIRVTAEKRRRESDMDSPVIAQRVVRAIISEWPFPGPQGPVQSNASIQTGGSVAVHWGKMTSTKEMFVKRPIVGLPWFDAYDRVKFEYGYDRTNEPAGSTRKGTWQASTAYNANDIVYPTTASIMFDFIKTSAGAEVSDASEPDFASAAAVGDTVADGTMTWTAFRLKSPWRTLPGGNYDDDSNYLWELVGKSFDDPWVEARARGNITNAIVTDDNPHPFAYTAASMDELATPTAGYSNWFQKQTVNSAGPFPYTQKEVIFPRIDYRFWKDTAIAGQGTDGVYYLQWVADDTFRDATGTVKTFKQWTDIINGALRGFYFFDTKNAQNPQTPGGEAFLTPAVKIASTGGGDWMMSGFIYLNSVSFGTKGVQGLTARYNFPGEPFRDIGYPELDGAGNWIPAGNEWQMKNANNGEWDYEDVNGNGIFDLVLETRTMPSGASARVPIPYRPGCTVGTDCSEPHEPYLNLIYPLDACCSGGVNPYALTVAWEDPAAQTRRPKKKFPAGSYPAVDGTDKCTNAADFDLYCTSNRFDRDGYADRWSGAGLDGAPVLDGVFFNEGTLDSEGNARYFGSVLIQGDIDSTGTNEVWFDERLIKDEWPPRDWPFPRVIITAISTDP
ncbi:MAG TPA: pilus assembly PilX N-terminal domain-containing protein [Thermoanaerobaculia bacterium]|nr:pilus assembly PilX N-terminal domain-containing protein [Thermoanaerobaculia bacterium]